MKYFVAERVQQELSEKYPQKWLPLQGADSEAKCSSVPGN
jgi:hypothetical protein